MTFQENGSYEILKKISEILTVYKENPVLSVKITEYIVDLCLTNPFDREILSDIDNLTSQVASNEIKKDDYLILKSGKDINCGKVKETDSDSIKLVNVFKLNFNKTKQIKKENLEDIIRLNLAEKKQTDIIQQEKETSDND